MGADWLRSRLGPGPVENTWSTVRVQDALRSDARALGRLRNERSADQTQTGYDPLPFVRVQMPCASDSVRGTIHSMKCAFCNKPLPQGAVPEAVSVAIASCELLAGALDAESPKSSVERGRTGEVAGRCKWDGPTRPPKATGFREHVRPQSHSAARVPMAAARRPGTREGAVGYRLVFPTRTPDDVPRLSPPSMRLAIRGLFPRPFQAPSRHSTDRRTDLPCGVDQASGGSFLPKPDGTIPGLTSS